MAECYYEPTPATDGATMNPVPGAVFQVFEIADTTFSTPLSLRVGSGNPTTTVTASETLATLPGVYVTSPNYEHIFKSGDFQWRRDSIDGAKKAVEESQIAAANAAAAAEAVQTQANNGEFIGPVGPQGEQGIPGLNAVENDVAFAAAISTSGTETDTVLRATYAPKSGPFLVTVPNATVGEGKMLNTNVKYETSTTGGLSLIKLNHKNTALVPGNLFMGLQVITDSVTTDSAAGIHITNLGESDALYIAAEGKAGTVATNPTGLGIDLNRSGVNERNSAGHKGYGIQVYDYSQTDQGTSGPCSLFIMKRNNPDTNHRLVYLRANRRALEIVTPDGAGYSGSAPLILTADNAGAYRWQVNADGSNLFRNGVGANFAMPSGNSGYILGTSVNTVDVRSGSGGFRVLDNVGAVNLNISGTAGNITPKDGATIVANGATGIRIGSTSADKLGFFGRTPVARPAAVAVTPEAIHAALVSIGLIAA